MKCITVQHKNVYNTLMNTGLYRASEEFVSEILVKPYKFMQKQFDWKSTPIFLSPVGYFVEMGGAKFNSDSVAIELDIPDEYIKMQRYYDWSDFIYFTEMPWEFEQASNVDKFKTVNDWAKTILNIKVSSDCTDQLQVCVEELHKEWVTNKTTKLGILESKHNDSGGTEKLQPLLRYI